MRIDSHQHFWHHDPTHHVWMTDAMAALQRDYLPDQLAPRLLAARFDGTIAVQDRQMIEETEWLLALTDRHRSIKGVVGWVDLCSPELPAQLERFAPHPGLVGVRHVLHDEPDERARARPDGAPAVAHRTRRGNPRRLLRLHPAIGAATCSGALRPAPAPLAVDQTPHAVVGRLVTEDRRQAAGADLIEALQHREAAQCGRDADGGESGMAGRGIRTAVVHRRADGDARRHLVVEQATDPRPQQRIEPIVERVVRAARVRVEGEAAVEMLDGGGQLPAVARNDEERRVAKGLVWRSAVGSTSRGVRVSRRLAFVSDQHSISRILDHLGLRSSQQDKPPPAREVLRVAEAGEGPSATPHRLDRPTAS